MKYLLIDEHAHADSELASLKNLAAAVFRLEHPGSPENMQELLLLERWLADRPDLSKMMARWIRATLMRKPKEPLIRSSMSRVADQIGKIATRTAQVVAGTTMPSRARKRAPDLAATRMGRGLAGELLRCVSCQGE